MVGGTKENSLPSENSFFVSEFLLTELAEKMAEGALKGRWEWERKIPAGGARGPRAAASSQNQLVL